MCGLVGFVITDATATQVSVEKHQRFFRKALFIDTLRGSDSTGVARIDTDYEVNTYKKAMPGYDYLEHNIATEFLSEGSSYLSALLGHNRAATQGAVNSANAHPFTHGAVTMMHNGTLLSSVGVGTKFAVDSENICFTLSKCKTDEAVVKMLEKLDGAYALVWYHEEDKTINFARNDQRTLHWQETDDGFLYASEGWMIEGATSEQFQQPIKTKSAIKPLPVGDWTRINLETGEVSHVPFQPDEGYTRYSSYAYDYGSSTKSVALPSLTKGDSILTEYKSHAFSTVNGKESLTVYSELVSQADTSHLPRVKVTLAGFERKDLDEILGGKRVFVSEYGGSYESGNGAVQAWVRDPYPAYTMQEVRDNGVVEGDDSVFDALIEGNQDEIPFDGQVGGDAGWCDNRGNSISRETMLKEAQGGCAWCTQHIDIDKEDFLWNGDYLMHMECSTHYDDSYGE